MDPIQKITSFTVDHRVITPGLYISMTMGDITTYDLRTRKPNCGDLMDNSTMHSFEHMFATYIRNGVLRSQIIYFGPMGCQTGFYLLVRGENGAPADDTAVLAEIRRVLTQILAHEGPVFGASEVECGNYRNLSLEAAQKEAARIRAFLDAAEVTFRYPQADPDQEAVAAADAAEGGAAR